MRDNILQGLWSLRTSFNEKFTKILVITFPHETIFASYNDHWKLIDMPIDGFDNKRRTLACGNLLGDYIVQVTTYVFHNLIPMLFKIN